MAKRQSFLPGHGYIVEEGDEESFLPGYGYVKEERVAAAAAARRYNPMMVTVGRMMNR